MAERTGRHRDRERGGSGQAGNGGEHASGADGWPNEEHPPRAIVRLVGEWDVGEGAEGTAPAPNEETSDIQPGEEPREAES